MHNPSSAMRARYGLRNYCCAGLVLEAARPTCTLNPVATAYLELLRIVAARAPMGTANCGALPCTCHIEPAQRRGNGASFRAGGWDSVYCLCGKP